MFSEVPLSDAYWESADAEAALEQACAGGGAVSRRLLGESEARRPIYGYVMGEGRRTASLVAGAHSDEPVGPEALRRLVQAVATAPERFGALLRGWRLAVVPHVNPDGEAINRAWRRGRPDAQAYLQHAFREPPGRDVEFGYPAMRPENRAVSAFLRAHAPFDFHASLHGMGFSDGAMLLIDRRWGYRSRALQQAWAAQAEAAGLLLHDYNRQGEKGFFYLGPGFMTTPEGAAMRRFFRARADEETAALFHDASMDFVRRLGGDPLCLVTELPLFLVEAGGRRPGFPAGCLAFREALPALRLRLAAGEDIAPALDAFGVRPLPLRTACRLALAAVALGLEQALRPA